MSTSDSKSGPTQLERSCSSVSASSTTSSRRSARRKRKRIKHTVMPLKKRPGRHEVPCDVHRITNLDHEDMYQSACFWVAQNPEEKDRSFKEEVFVGRNDEENVVDEYGRHVVENQTRETDGVFTPGNKDRRFKEDGFTNRNDEENVVDEYGRHVVENQTRETDGVFTPGNKDRRFKEDGFTNRNDEENVVDEYGRHVVEHQTRETDGIFTPGNKDRRFKEDGFTNRNDEENVVDEYGRHVVENQTRETDGVFTPGNKDRRFKEDGFTNRNDEENVVDEYGRHVVKNQTRETDGVFTPGNKDRRFKEDGFTNRNDEENVVDEYGRHVVEHQTTRETDQVFNPEQKNGRFKEEELVNRNNEENIVVETREMDEVFTPAPEPPPEDATYSEERMFYGVRKSGVQDGANVEQFSPLPSPRTGSRMSSISDDTHSAISSEGAGMLRVGWTSDLNSSGPEYSGITDEDSDDESRKARRDIRSVNDKWREDMRPRDNVVIARDVTSFESRDEKQEVSSENSSSADRDYRRQNPPPYNGRDDYPRETVPNGHIYRGEDIPPEYTPASDGQFYPGTMSRGSDVPMERTPSPMERTPSPMERTPSPMERTPSPIKGPSQRVQRMNEQNTRYERFETSTIEQSRRTGTESSRGRTSTPTRKFTSSDTELLRDGNDVEDDELSHRSLPVINKRTNTKYYSVDELRKSTKETKTSDVTPPPYVPRLSDAYMRYQPPRRVRPRHDDPAAAVKGAGEERDVGSMKSHEEPKMIATSYEMHHAKMMVPEGTQGDDKENMNPNEESERITGDRFDGYRRTMEDSEEMREDSMESNGYRRTQDDSRDSDGHQRTQEDKDESYSYSYSSVKDFSDKPRSRAPLRGGMGSSDEAHKGGYPGEDGREDVQPGEAYVVEEADGQQPWEESKEFYGYRRNDDDPNYSYATPRYPGERPRESPDQGSEGPGGELIGKAEVQQTFSTNEDHRSEDGRWEESKQFYGYRRLQDDGNKARVGEEFVGVKEKKTGPSEDQRSTEQSQEFYGYRRIQGDHVYSHLTPAYMEQSHDQPPRDQSQRDQPRDYQPLRDQTRDPTRSQKDSYEESKEFYGYRRQYTDGGPERGAAGAEPERDGKTDGGAPDRIVTSAGYSVLSQKAMVTRSQTYNQQQRTTHTRTEEHTSSSYMNGTSYPRDYSPLRDDHPPEKDPPTRRMLPPPSGETTKRLHTRSERDTLRREGRYRPEMKPPDPYRPDTKQPENDVTKPPENDVGMKMFRQRYVPEKRGHSPSALQRKHEHPPSMDLNHELSKKSKTDEPDLSKSDPEFADKFREITEKRRQNTTTKTTTTNRTETSTKRTEISRRNAAESCNKNVDELVTVFNTLEDLQSQQQPGGSRKEEHTIPPGQVKKIVKEGILNTALQHGRKISPATSVSQKLREIENILDSVDKNNQQRMRPREAHERRRPWSTTTEEFPKGSLSEGELYIDEIYTTEDVRDTSEVYRGSPRRGRTRRRRYHDSRAYSDGEIEEFRRPYYQRRVITPGTPVNIRLYGLNLEKTQLDRSYNIDWAIFDEVPVNESVERSQQRPNQAIQQYEPVFQDIARENDVEQLPQQPEIARENDMEQLPWQPEIAREYDVGVSVPTSDQTPRRFDSQADDSRETVYRDITVTSVKRQTQSESHDRKETSGRVPPAKRPSDSYPPEDQPPEKHRYTEEERPSEEQPLEQKPPWETMDEESPYTEVTVEQCPGEDVGDQKPRYLGTDHRSDEYIEVEVEHMEDDEGGEVPPGGSTSTPRSPSGKRSSKKQGGDYWEEHDESFDESRTRVQSSSSDQSHMEHTTHTTRTTKTTRTKTETTVKKVTSSTSGKSGTTDIVTHKDDQPAEKPDEEQPARGDEVAHEYLEMNADTGRPVNLTMLGRVVEDDDVDMSQSKEDVFLHTRLKMVTEQKNRSDKVTKEDVETSLRKSSDEAESTDSEHDIEGEAKDAEDEAKDTEDGPIFIPISRGPVKESVEKTEQKHSRSFHLDHITFEDHPPAVHEDIHVARTPRETFTKETLDRVFNPPFVLETDFEKEDVPDSKSLPSFEWISQKPGHEVSENVECAHAPSRDFDMPDFAEFEKKPGVEVDECVTAKQRVQRLSPSLIEGLEETREQVHEEMQREILTAPELPEIQRPQGEIIQETCTSEKREVNYELPELQPAPPAPINENIAATEETAHEVVIPDLQELMPEPEPRAPVDETIFPPEKVVKDYAIIDFQEVVAEFQATPPRNGIHEVVPSSEKLDKPDLPEFPEQDMDDLSLELQEPVQEPPRPPVTMETDVASTQVDIEVVADEDTSTRRKKPREYREVPKKMPVPETRVENETVTETHTTKTVTVEKTFTKNVHYVSDRPGSPHATSDLDSSSEVSLHSSGYADISSGDVTGDVDETDVTPTTRRKRSRRGNRFDDIRRSGHLVPVSVVTIEPESEQPAETGVPVSEEPAFMGTSRPEKVQPEEMGVPEVQEPAFRRKTKAALRPEMYLLSSDDEEGEDKEPVDEPELTEEKKVMKPEMEQPLIDEEELREIGEEICKKTAREDKDFDMPEEERSKATEEVYKRTMKDDKHYDIPEESEPLQEICERSVTEENDINVPEDENFLELSQEVMDELLEKEVQGLPKEEEDEVDNAPSLQLEEVDERVVVGEKIGKDEIEPVELEPSEVMEDVEKTHEESVKDFPEVECEVVEEAEEVKTYVQKEEGTEEEEDIEIEKEIPVEVDLTEKLLEEKPRKDVEVVEQEPEPEIQDDDVTGRQPMSHDDVTDMTQSTVETIIVEKTHSEISTTVTEISTKKVDTSVSSDVHIRVDVNDQPEKLRDVPISAEDDVMEPDDEPEKLQDVPISTEDDVMESEDETVKPDDEDVTDFVQIRVDIDGESEKLRDVPISAEDDVTEPEDEARKPNDVTEYDETQEGDETRVPEEEGVMEGLSEKKDMSSEEPSEVDERVVVGEKIGKDEIVPVELEPSEVVEDVEKTHEERMKYVPNEQPEEIDENVLLGEKIDKDELEPRLIEAVEDVEKSRDERVKDLPEVEYEVMEEVETWFGKEKITEVDEEGEISEEIEKEIPVEVDLAEKFPEQEPRKDVDIVEQEPEPEHDDVVGMRVTFHDVTMSRDITDTSVTQSTVETIIVEKTHSEISTTVTEISTKKVDVSLNQDEPDFVQIRVDTDDELEKLRDIPISADDDVTESEDEAAKFKDGAAEVSKPDEEPKPDDDDEERDIPVEIEKIAEPDEPCETAPVEMTQVETEEGPGQTVYAILDINYETPLTTKSGVEIPLVIEQDKLQAPVIVVDDDRQTSSSSDDSSSSSSEGDASESSMSSDEEPVPYYVTSHEIVPEDVPIITEVVPILEEVPKADDIAITESAPTEEDVPLEEDIRKLDIGDIEAETEVSTKMSRESDAPSTSECEVQTETDMSSETTQTEVTTKTTRETMTKGHDVMDQESQSSGPESHESEMQTEILRQSNTASQTSFDETTEELTISSETRRTTSEITSKYSEQTSRYSEDITRDQRKVSLSDGETQTDVIVDDAGSQTRSGRMTSKMSSMTERGIGGTMVNTEGTQTELFRDDEGYSDEAITRITRQTTTTRREYSETTVSEDSSMKELKSDCPVCLQSLENTQYSYIKVSDLSRYTAMSEVSTQTSDHETEAYEYCFACGRHSSEEHRREIGETSQEYRRRIGESSDKTRREMEESSEEHRSRIGETSEEHRSRIGESSEEHRIEVGETSEEHRESSEVRETRWEEEMRTETGSHFAIHVVGDERCSLYCRRLGNHECMLQKLASIIKANRKAAQEGGGLEESDEISIVESESEAVIGREYRDVSVQTEGAILPTDFEVFSEKDFEIYYDDERSPSWTAMTIAEGVQKEHESLIKQLDLLRDVNQKLRDQKDAIQAAHEEQSKNYLSLNEELALAQTRSSTPKRKPVTRKGSEMSKYFAAFDSGGGGRLESVDDEASTVTQSKRKLRRTKKLSGLQSLTDTNEFVGDGAEFECDRVFQDGELRTEEEERMERIHGNGEEIVMSQAERLKVEQEFRKHKTNMAPELQNGVSRTLLDSQESVEGPLTTRTPPVGTEDVKTHSIIPEVNSHLQRLYKVVFVGNSGVGKSSFIHRYCYEIWKPSYTATIGVDFQVKSLQLGLKKIALQLWDTAGQERFRSITKQYFRKADGVVLLYDLTSESSFLEIKSWMASVEEAAEPGCTVMLVGNKLDLCQEDEKLRVVDYKDAQKVAEDYGILYAEASAKTGENVNEAMEKLARVLQEREDWQLHSVLNLKLEDEKNKKKSCCGKR